MSISKNTRRLEGRVALVTGASRGIGAAVAEGFAREGAHVILLARTQGALEAVDDAIRAAGGTATLLPFDLAENKKISAITPVIAERFRRLDILVGNAGILGDLSPVAMSDPKIFDAVFKVNFFANYHLIRALDPLLRGSDAGRAIFVTAGAARQHAPFWGAHAAAKAALERMVETYAAETAFSPLKVNIIDPGAVRTKLRAEAFPAENTEALPLPETLVERFIELASPNYTDTGRIVAAA